MCFVVRKTTSEQEHDPDHPISCRCKKHRQLVRLEGVFIACFPRDVPMVPSSAITVTTNGEHLMCGGFSLGETMQYL
jgi:hypothetical protein